MTNDTEPRSLISRFLGLCFLLLAGAIALTLALDLLAKIWVWLLLLAVLEALIAGVIWFARRRRDRW